MHQARLREVRLALAVAALLCLLAVPALAGDRPWEREGWYTTRDGMDASEEAFASDLEWLEPQSPADDRHAVEYKRGLSLNLEDTFVFSIQRPPAGEWAPGLALELRF